VYGIGKYFQASSKKTNSPSFFALADGYPMDKVVHKPKKAARSNSFVIPLATVSGLLILFLIYVFWYVSAQDKYYNDRAFRVLSVLSDSFAGKVGTIQKVLGASAGAIRDQIRTYAPAKKPNQAGQPYGAATSDTDPAKQYVAQHLDEYGVTLDQVSANWKWPCSPASREGKLSLRLEDSTDFSMQAVYTFSDKTVECKRAKTDNPFEISAIVHLQPSIRSLIEELNEGFYEDVLIADAEGVVLYQQSNRGVRISDLNDLVRLRPDGSAVVPAPDKPEAAPSAPEKSGGASAQGRQAAPKGETKAAAAKSPGPFSTISSSGNIANVQLGDSSVRLYLQPTLLTIQKKSRVSRLVFCGLRSAKHVQADTLSVPNTLVIWGALILPLTFALGWPLLKVFYVSPKERLQFGQILALLLSILVGTVLLTLTTLNWSYTSRETDDSEDRLPRVAERMKSQVQFEMQQALTELNRLSIQEDLLPSLFAKKSWQIAQYFQTHISSYQKTDANHAPPYSYFRYAVLLDVDGWQQAKFTAEWPTPRVNVSKETYFQEVHLSNLDTFIPHGAISPFLANPTLFRLDLSTSPNTGEFVAVLSAPYPAASSGQPSGLSLSASKANANPSIQQELLVVNFESLVDSVLPPGYGFAVLNRAGKVQFHSVSRRNLLEDFLAETQFNPELVSLLQQGGTDFFHARYLGRAQVLYITPLDIFQHPPLSLVVFRDDDRATAGNKAVVAVYSSLAIAYVLAIWILVIIYFYAIGLNYPLHGIWPSLRRRNSYIRVGITSLILLGAFLFGCRSLQPTDTVYFALALGFVSFLIPVTEMGGRHPFSVYTIRTLVVGYLATLLYYSSGIVSWTFYLFLIALLGFAWSSKFCRLLYKLRRFTFRWKTFVLNCTYTFVAISMLLSIVVVPCIGFFRFAYETVELRAVQLDQIELAGQLAQRRDRIQRYYDRIYARGLEKQRQDDLIDRHDLAFFNCMASPTDAPADEDELKDSTLENFIGNIAEMFQSDTYSGLLELERTREPRQFEWHISKGSASAACASLSSPLIVLKAKYSQTNSSQSQYLIASEVPKWQGYTAGGRALLVLAILFLCLWIYFVSVRIFLIDWEDAPRLEFIDSRKELRGSTIIIGHPKSGKSSSAEEIVKGEPIDFAELAATGNWHPILPADPRLILDHFECGIDDPAINLKKLEFLERLIYVEDRKIILLSTVDPTFYLVSGFPEVVSANPDDLSSNVQILDRWAVIFSDFHKARFEDRSIRKFRKRLGIQRDKLLSSADKKQRALHLILMDIVRQECDHTAILRKIGFRLLMTRLQNPDNPGVSTLRRELVEDVLDHADAYYRSLWSTCTKNERLVLYQLSKDGWANPRNRKELQDLLRRGLIVKNSGFQVMNLSFRQFVLNYQYPEEVAAWDQEVNKSTGKAVRSSLLVAAAVLGVWLIYSQQQVFHLAIGYAGAIGGAAATVTGLVAAFRFRGTRNAPDAAKSA
jgi:hypothetical protein